MSQPERQPQTKRIAVVLSGCGFQDGAEITESVSTLIALGQMGATYNCFAPKVDFQAKNHLSGDPESQTRNTLTESARICRGEIKDIESLDVADFDAVVFPGGFGAALHLSDWAQKGSGCTVHPKVVQVVNAFHQASKPIGVMCIAPTLVAKILGKEHEVTVTIGNDGETAQEIEKTGAHHETCDVDDYITDRENKVVSTPAYMYGEAAPSQVFKGIQGLVKELVEMS